MVSIKSLVQRLVATDDEIKERPCNEVGHDYVDDGYQYKMDNMLRRGSSVEILCVEKYTNKKCRKCSRLETGDSETYTIELNESGPVVKE